MSDYPPELEGIAKVAVKAACRLAWQHSCQTLWTVASRRK